MTVGLAMIVRDEAETLPATLESVIGLFDTWTIVDTGSEDDTPNVIRQRLEGIPGTLHKRPWVSHAHNRTELLELARNSAADYLLLLDADCVLTLDGDLPDLTADMYVVRLAGDFQHTLPLLVSTRRKWRYEGAAHAVIKADGPVTVQELVQASLTETRTATPRPDKFVRDAQALEAEFDPRSIFYLAQTYRDLGYDEAAADLYRFRVRHTSAHPQERFWACYQEGLLRLETDPARGAAILLEAWGIRPTRAEPLWKLARHYRLGGNPSAALMFAERACQIPRTTDDHFVLAWVYDWGCLIERALARQAVGDTEGAERDFRELAQLPGEPGDFALEQLAREAA